jgi:hypothetical protein
MWRFADLRLAIVDEQHRFGVAQRMELGAKGQATDVLVMTATPIPRSLALAQYGDMDVACWTKSRRGRSPVKTALVSTGADGRGRRAICAARWPRGGRPIGSARWSRKAKGRLVAAEARFAASAGGAGRGSGRPGARPDAAMPKAMAMAAFRPARRRCWLRRR